jgi:hypothetical protein
MKDQKWVAITRCSTRYFLFVQNSALNNSAKIWDGQENQGF